MLHRENENSSDVVGHEPVQVTAGDDVILPCHLDPPFDVSELTVDWTRDGRTVHFYRNRRDDDDDQVKQFRGRTSLFHSELTRGNISLKLTNVNKEDAGVYSCYVPRLESQNNEGHVLLIVSQKDPLGRHKKPTNNGWRGFIPSSVLFIIPLLAVTAFS